MQDLNIGEIVHPHYEGVAKKEDKPLSMVSPMPGNTPPMILESQNNEMAVIQQFLKANNALPASNQGSQRTEQSIESVKLHIQEYVDRKIELMKATFEAKVASSNSNLLAKIEN